MQVEITKQAKKNIEKLPATVKKRCADAVRVLAGNTLKGETLKGEFYILRRYRVGYFRIVYEFESENDLLTIHALRHRRDVYR